MSARVEALSGLSAIPPEFVRPADERAGLGDAFQIQAVEKLDQDGGPRIPVVDISPFVLSAGDDGDKGKKELVVEAVRAAASEWGVMHIAGHGIPDELIDRLRAAGTGFFALPVEAKEAYANDPGTGRLQGYGSRLATSASGQREWMDYFFHLLWPAHPPDYVDVTREFGGRISKLASTMLAILSLGLQVAPSTRLEDELTNDNNSPPLLQMKINYYPPCPQPELAVGVEEHTDVSALSFILHNGVPGLQVRHAGRWVTACSEPGTIVVHVGDALEILTNGRYTSVLHRSLVNREAVRVSWAVFCEPQPEAVVLRPLPELLKDGDTPRFTPRTFKEHLDVKLFKKQQQQQLEEEHDDDSKCPITTVDYSTQSKLL